MEAVRRLQDGVDGLLVDLQRSLQAMSAERDLKKNVILERRTALIAKAQEAKSLPDNFWATVLLSHRPLVDEFFGAYDARLVSQYLKTMNVTYGPKGAAVSLTFQPNPFFEETELSAELLDVQVGAAAGSVADPANVGLRCSGITWKPGHGPALDDDDEEEEDEEEEGDDDNGKPNRRTRGPSFLDVFSVMPTHPVEDDTFKDAEEDVLHEAVGEWEDEVSDRRELLACLIEEVWMDPLTVLMAGDIMANGNSEEEEEEDDDDDDDTDADGEEEEEQPPAKVARREA